MSRHFAPRLAAGALLAAMALGCSDASAPSDNSIATLASATRHGPTLTPQSSGTTARLIGVHAVSQDVAWVSGVGGTFAVTTDRGATWHAGVVPGAEALQFRDVQGVSATEAYLLSIGPGAESRIYHTTDGGESWDLQFENEDPSAFYDCFAFWTPNRGFAFSDAVSGRFPVLRTTDGETWVDIGDNLPEAQPGEFAFASSGTCTAAQGGKRGWIGTGGTGDARVLATTDGGESWTAFPTPIVQGAPEGASGIFTIDFRDPHHGILAGGDLVREAEVLPNVARSGDGGATWELATPFPFGTVFGLSYVGKSGLPAVFGVARGGVAWSPDEGQTWNEIPGFEDFWAVSFANQHAGWMVGGEGRIVRIAF
ncbi:MAG: WD40/YVTN/BNR-like repeat-containing protein [Gemmatimonadales bacterium]